MTPLFDKMLGNGSKDRELAEEMRTILEQMKQERARFEKLLESGRASSERLHQLGEPIAKAASDVDAVTSRLAEMEKRFAAMTELATRYETLDERAEYLAKGQGSVQAQVTQVLQEAEQIRSAFEDIGNKIEIANQLKERLDAFMETERPFQQMRSEAETLRGQVEGTSEHVARLREQHDRLMDAHKLALSKMEALDRRRDDLSRSLQDKERRVEGVEVAVRGIDGVQQSIDGLRREIGSLKAMADMVAQKTAALEAQRETADRALAQAEHLDRAMRQIDSRMQQQQENERAMTTLSEQVAAVRSLHESVVERSGEISQLQRAIDERTAAARQDLVTVSDETKKTVDRFDFERRGMESVTQRVADLRAALSDCESRYRGLNEPSKAVGELASRTQELAVQLARLTAEAAGLDQEMTKVRTIRRDLDEAGRTAQEIGARATRIEEVRPALQTAMHDLEQLNGVHARVVDALEQTQIAHDEITRMRDAQSETRSWLSEVEASVSDLKGRAGEVQAMAPTIEFVQKQTHRIGESMAAIESRREFVEDMQRRINGLESMQGHLSEREQQLQARMEAAEKRFTGLEGSSEESERLTMAVASVTSSLNEAGRKTDEIRKAVAGIETRSKSVEALAERTQVLRDEIEQRQNAVAEITKDLQRASELRKEAAQSAQQLGETSKQLASSLAKAEKRATGLGEMSTQLEGRATDLAAVETRLDAFDERLTKWDHVDQDIARSLDEIISRQETVGALQADLDRMYAMAEKTTAGVREIAASYGEIEDGRETVKEILARLQGVQETANAIDERKRQLAKAEERLARAEGLLVDVESSLEALQGQKAIVDQAVEKAGSLQFLVKQAEAAIEGLRDERKTTGLVRSAIAVVHDEEEEEVEESIKKAA